MTFRLPHLPRTLKAAFASLLGLVLVACESLDSQDSERFIFLKDSEPLFVKFDMSMNPTLQMSMPDVAGNMREQRRRDYMKVMQELLYLYQLPVEVHLLGEREKPGNGPVLDIFAIRFEQDSSGEIRSTIKVRLYKYGDLNTLGVYTNRNLPSVAMNGDKRDEAYQETIREPLREMLDDLMLHFETEEDREMVEAPLREFE